MASKTQLEILEKGVDSWNKWREKNEGVIVDLVGADFNAVDLCRVDLRSADLSEADLSEAIFDGANFHRANLRDANLSESSFIGANLREARFRNANLNESNFDGADFFHASLYGADSIGSSFSGANLRNARLFDANFTDADADLTMTDLNEAMFGDTIIANTNLAHSNGLETCTHIGPSIIDHRTLERSGKLPIAFLRDCGLPEKFIDYLPSILGDPFAFYSCFISYSHADQKFARRLHDRLQGEGIRCWRDERQMFPGDDIYEQVDRGIKLWDKVLLCCSKASLTSWWVDDEIDRTFAKERTLMEKRGKKVLSLIPLDLDGYLFSGEWQSGKAQQIKSRFAADFTGWENNDAFERAFKDVVSALSSEDRSREPAPKPKL